MYLIERKRDRDDDDADHDQSDKRSGIVSEIGVVFDVISQAALRADHLSRGQQYERHGESLIAADKDLLQRRRENDRKQHRKFSDI